MAIPRPPLDPSAPVQPVSESDPGVDLGPQSEASERDAEADATAQASAQVRACEPRVAACVRAANHLLALEPVLIAHAHAIQAIAGSGSGPLDNDSVLVVTTDAGNASDLGATRIAAIEQAPLPSPATRPIEGELLARLAELEVLLGSLRALAPRLDALATRFFGHVHPYRFVWGPVATLDRGDVTILYGSPTSSDTAPPSVTLPAIDYQAALPCPGTPSPQQATEARVAAILSLVADLEPTYARVSSAAQGFASHHHHAPLGRTSAAVVREPGSAASTLVAFTGPSSSYDAFFTGPGRPG